MQKLSIFTLLIWLLSVTSVNAQSNLKVKTIDGKKCSLHKVLPKETWSSVSRKYNLKIDEIKSVNRGINDLKIGQIINIPEVAAIDKQKPVEQSQIISESKSIAQIKPASSPKSFTHAVAQGETLYGIAKQYLVTVEELKKWNNLKTSSAKIGQIIFVSNPSGEIALQTTKPDVNVAEVKKEARSIEIKSVPKETPKETIKISEVKTATVEPVKEISKDSDAKAIVPETKKEISKPIVAEKSSSSIVVTRKEEDSKNPVLADAGNKIIAVSNQKEEPISKPTRTSSSNKKSKNGNSVVEVTESGMAAWIKDGDINQNKFYGLHRNAPLGTIIKVTNRMNDEYVFVKIVGQLPDTGDNEKQLIKVSEAAAKRIGAVDEKFQVELSYGMLQ